MIINKDIIPKGQYCHTPIKIEDDGKIKIKTCPYWSNHFEHGHQNSGSCSFMNINDWDAEYITHLWDMVKECGINMDLTESNE